jgi:hypothetical protein
MSEVKAQCSFPSPSKGGAWREREFSPVSAADFLAQDQGEGVDWVLEDYLPVGGLVILAAKPKVGKSTLAYHLAVKVAQGEPFLGRATAKGGVLILALEEHPRDVRLRLKELGAVCDNLYIHTGRLDHSAFESITKFTRERGINLILVDTLGKFWRIPDENDPATVERAITPLLDLARETGACVLLIHHFRKSEGSEGDEIRGSGALLGSVDVALLLYRDRDASQNQRKLCAIGRYEDTPSELAIRLKDGAYEVVNDSAAPNRTAEKECLRTALTSTPLDIETLAKNAKVPVKRAYRHMKSLVAEGKALPHGKGVKGDPFLYSSTENALSSCPPSLGAERERELIPAAKVLIEGQPTLEN